MVCTNLHCLLQSRVSQDSSIGTDPGRAHLLRGTFGALLDGSLPAQNGGLDERRHRCSLACWERLSSDGVYVSLSTCDGTLERQPLSLCNATLLLAFAPKMAGWGRGLKNHYGHANLQAHNTRFIISPIGAQDVCHRHQQSAKLHHCSLALILLC